MARSPGTAFSWLRAALLCATAIILVDATAASARVGVTSATNGDPLGKPPAEPERILRIGIDVQANEVITTGDNDRAHLVFLDGTSLTVGPNAQLTIDKFVYDPNSKTGELAINATKGVFRLVGGKISKTNPITITTPSSTIGIRGGIIHVQVTRGFTRSTFLFGHNMTVTAQGNSENITRPGSQVTTNTGSPPGPPVMLGHGALSGQMASLEGNSGGGNSGGGNSGGGNAGGGNSGGSGGNADQGARGFGQQNSGRGPGGGGGLPGGGGFGPGGNPGPGNGNINGAQNAVNGSNNQNLNNGGSSSSSNSTSTKIVITRGRYLADPAYNNFNSSNLSVTPIAANNKASGSNTDTVTTTTTTTTNNHGTSTSTSQTLGLTVPGFGSVSMPWQQDTLDNGFSIKGSALSSIASSFGVNLRDGTGYVSAKGEFFAYVFTTNSNTKVGVFGGTPTSTSGTGNFPTSGIATFAVGVLGNPTRLPFADSTVGDNSSLNNAKIVGNLYTAYSTTLAGTVGHQIPDARATGLQATISISGQGNQQKSYMGVYIGQFLRDISTTGGTITSDNGLYMAGNFGATYRTSSNDNIGRLTANESTTSNGSGNGNAIFGTSTGDGSGSAIVLTPDKMVTTNTLDGSNNIVDMTTTRTSQAALNQPYTSLTGSDYFTVIAAYKTTTTTDVSQTARTTQTLNGFFGGLVDQLDAHSNITTRAVTNTDATSVALKTDATTNRVSATFGTSAWDGTTAASFKLGGTTGSNSGTSAFINDKIYAARDRLTGMSDTTTVGGSSTGVTANTQIISYDAAAIDSLFTNAGVSKCTCSFLTWGWWGGDVAYDNTSGYNAGGRDRLNFASYVAGTLATTTQLPNTGSATFTGHVVGNVLNGNKSYIAVGGYSNTWSWGSGSGNVSISNFDGATYTGTTTLNSGTVQFSGSLSGAGRTGSVNGAFFQSGGQVAGQAGNFAVSGTNYKAAGTFAAQKQ